MVFGNMGDDSGTGVAFTRDPNTGEDALYGEYLTNAQGEDVVAGVRTAPKIAQMESEMPEVYAEFKRIGDQLEKHYRDVQDLEFTIERGKLYMLQTRSAKRTAAAAVKIAIDMVDEGLITKEEAVGRIDPSQVDQLLRAQFEPKARQAATRIAKGLNASPGAAVGRAVFTADHAVEWVGRGEKVVLIREETAPDDFHGMAVAQGILTARGGATSHAAVVARQIGKPCVAGSAELHVDAEAKHARSNITGLEINEGDWVSLDGSTGEIFVGALPTVEARFEDQPELQTILGWADGFARMAVWTNADKPEEAAQARVLRRPRDRPLPDRAHVPRGRAARDRPRRDPHREPGDPAQGPPRPRRDPHGRRERRRSPSSTRRWPSSRPSSRATSRGSSGRWTACRSSSA